MIRNLLFLTAASGAVALGFFWVRGRIVPPFTTPPPRTQFVGTGLEQAIVGTVY